VDNSEEELGKATTESSLRIAANAFLCFAKDINGKKGAYHKAAQCIYIGIFL